MHESPRVSVIVPFRNAAADLPHTFAQLQELQGTVEIICVDDASTDESAALAAGFCEAENRARLICRAEPGGSTRARMTGVAAARGEFVWFCDADDEWDPRIITVMLREAERSQAEIVQCRAERVEADGRCWRMEGVRRQRTVQATEIATLVWTGQVRGYLWNKLIRRTLIPALAREPLTSQDDFLMMLDVLTRARSIHLIPDVMYRYLERPGSISTGTALKLQNVAHCLESAKERLLTPTATARDLRAAATFAVWFYLVPAIATPVHRGWDAAIGARIRAELAPQIAWSNVLRLASTQPSVALHAALIRVSGSRYPAWYLRARRMMHRG